MKKLTLLVILFTLVIQGRGQSPTEDHGNSVQLFLGASRHGTDNVTGVAFSAEYSHYFRKRLSLTGLIGTTIHDGKSLVDYWNSAGEISKTEVNFTTAGLQSGAALGFDFLVSNRHRLQGSFGIMIRYQTTSNPDIVGLALTFPYEGYDFPSRSVSIGGVTALRYSYAFGKGCFLGVRGWLQYDSNDNAINTFSLVVGKGL